MQISDFFSDRDNAFLASLRRPVSKAQLRRDKDAILTVLPKDGTPMTMAEVLLRAGENLGQGMASLVEEGKVHHLMIDERNAYAVVTDKGR